MYPIVSSYVENGKAIDKEFIDKAINLFGQTFPEARYDYNIMMNRICFYTDAETTEQYQQVNAIVYRYFRITGCSSSIPIVDPQSQNMMGTATNTQVIVVYNNHTKNLNVLKTTFPKLATIKTDEEGIINFLDENNRPVIIVNVKSQDRIEAAIRKLATLKKLDPGKVFIPLN